MKFTTATVLAFVAAVSADAVPEPEYSSTEPVYDPTYVDPPVYPTDYPTDYPVTYDPTYPTSTYDPAYPTTTPCTTSTDYPVDPVYPTYPPKYPSKEPIYPTTTPCTTSTDYPVYPEYPVSDYYPVYTTKVIDKYTTYCPYPTTYEHDGKKYEVTTVSIPASFRVPEGVLTGNPARLHHP